MRQVGTIPSEREARQFAAWLVAHQMPAHAEAENGGWVVWIREEDHLARAREALSHFRENPSDPQYQDAERTAQALAREEEAKRRQAQSNVVEMRGRWGSGAPGGAGVTRRSPLVLALIAFSVFVAIFAYGDTLNEPKRPIPGDFYRAITFVDPVVERGKTDVSYWKDVKKGEVWRLITPIFIHYSWAHIILNMMWLHSFGSQIEDRRGTPFMLFLVLALAISSNVGQAIEMTLRSSGVAFGGMSGVGYGLFGYVAIKAKYDRRESYYLSPGTTFIAMLWFVLCILRDIPPFSSLLEDTIPSIANTAHAVGLAVGALIAAAPLLVRKPA